MIWKALAFIGTLIGIGGIAYGEDQHKKRESEKERFEAEIKKKEEQLTDIERRYGIRSKQFRIMAEELARYKRQRAV